MPGALLKAQSEQSSRNDLKWLVLYSVNAKYPSKYIIFHAYSKKQKQKQILRLWKKAREDIRNIVLVKFD